MFFGKIRFRFVYRFVVFVYMLLLRLLVQLLAQGIIRYFHDAYQQLDFVIVSLSILDLVLSPVPRVFTPHEETDDAVQEGGSLSALRSLRLLRFLRLFRAKTFKVLLYKIGLVVISLKNFMIILFRIEYQSNFLLNQRKDEL